MGNSGAPDELYRNEGSGSFTLVLGTSISQLSLNTRAVVVLDMDNDGDVRKMPRADERRQQPRLAIASARCSREAVVHGSTRVISARRHRGQ